MIEINLGYFLIKNKIIFASAKNATRSLRALIKKYGGNSDVLNLEYQTQKNKLKNLISNKEVYILNRNPLDKINSGLWNYFETIFDIKPTEKDIFKNYRTDEFEKFIYITSSRFAKQNNNDNNLSDFLNPIELLSVFNCITSFLNDNKLNFYDVLNSDHHLNTNQIDIFYLINEIESFEYIDIGLLKNLQNTNLYDKLGFSDTSLNNKLLKSSSQKESKKLFSIITDYMIHGDRNQVKNKFDLIYGFDTKLPIEKIVKSSPFHVFESFLRKETLLYLFITNSIYENPNIIQKISKKLIL